MIEEFRDVKGYEGLYQISNLGMIKGVSKIKKPFIDKDGYEIVYLYKSGVKKNYPVHQLVAINFLNHIPNGNTIVIDHKNDDKLDNRVVNLQLVTHRFNVSKKPKGRSKYVGVYFNKNKNKWESRIRIGNKRKYLGLFSNEHEAHLAYQNKLNSIS